MEKIVILQRMDEAGMFWLPAGLPLELIDVILLNGVPVEAGKYAVVADKTAIDVLPADGNAIVSVILK